MKDERPYKFDKVVNFKGAVHLEYGIFATYHEAAAMSGIPYWKMLQMLNGLRVNTTKFVWSDGIRKPKRKPKTN